MAELVLLEGEAEGRRFPVAAEGMVIGRSTTAPIWIDDGMVSRLHARVWKEGKQCFLEDLGSSNGTRVNTKRITGKVSLHHNDLVTIGRHRLLFRDEDMPDHEMTITRQTVAEASNAEIFGKESGGKLRAVLELSHHLAAALDTGTLLSRLLDQLLVLFPHADRVQAILPSASDYQVQASRSRSADDSRGHGFSRRLVRKVVEQRVAVLAENTSQLSTNLSINGLGIHSLMAVPLQARGDRVLGVIGVDRYGTTQPFTGEDLDLLTAVVLQASSALENANLHQELLVKERIDGELSLAREIQLGILPADTASVGSRLGLEVHALLEPAREVGGDLYEVLQTTDGKLVLVLGDVSGKGIPAALFMAVTMSLVRTLARTAADPGALLRQVNDALVTQNPRNLFVSLFCGLFDPVSHKLTYASAGHPAPVRVHGELAEFLPLQPGMVAGVLPNLAAANHTITLEPGDAIVSYTDGVNEAFNAGGEMFGDQRLRESLTSTGLHNAADLTSRLLAAVRKHAGEHPQSDDIAILTVRRPD